MNESGIIAACISGDRSAQRALFEQYANGMLLLCTRYLPQRQEAEEAMLNGFFRLFCSLQEFRNVHEHSFSAWIRKIMIHECLAQLRRKKRILFLPEEQAADLPAGEQVLDRMQASEILKLVQELPDGYRTIFNLYVIEGFSHKEIAAALQVSEGTSKSQLNKARQLLQKKLRSPQINYNGQ